MRRMFYKCNSFNADISDWDVSRVTDMGAMFYLAVSFKASISKWNVSRVTNMKAMFALARAFNVDISEWDVARVQSMSKMFYKATTFNADISKWNVSRVKDMSEMFVKAGEFSRELCGHWYTLTKAMSRAQRTAMFVDSDGRICGDGAEDGVDNTFSVPTYVIVIAAVSITVVVAASVSVIVSRSLKLQETSDSVTPQDRLPRLIAMTGATSLTVLPANVSARESALSASNMQLH